MSAAAADRRLCRLLALDPDLGQGLDPETFAAAERRAVARVASLPRGPVPQVPSRQPELGFLVLDGLLLREVVVAGRVAAELIGPGELIRPFDEEEEPLVVPSDVHWTVLEDARLAVLDDRFVRAVASWPAIVSALVRRTIGRAKALAFEEALTSHLRVDVRLVMYLWHLAERFGRVHPDGVLLALPLTHETLGELVGAARPSVTTALSQLSRRGLVERRGRGFFMRGSIVDHLRFLCEALAQASEGRPAAPGGRAALSVIEGGLDLKDDLEAPSSS